MNLRQEGQELIHKTILFQQGKIRIIHETEYVLVHFISVIEYFGYKRQTSTYSWMSAAVHAFKLK